MALIPRLEKLQSEHADKLVILGIHCQAGDKNDIVPICKSQKINYPVYGSGQVKGKNFSGIPHAFLFDHKGELIAEGHPDEMIKKIDEECRNAPDWLLGGHDFVKLKAQAQAVASHKGLGKLLADLKKLASDPDKTTAEEAGWLKDSLTGYAQGQLDHAKEYETSDPAKALETYERISTMFAGDDFGTQAGDTLKKLKDDPSFKKEVEASRFLKAAEDALSRLRPCKSGGKVEPDCEPCRKKNAEALAGILPQLKVISSKYPDTNAGKEAADLLKSWGG